MCIMKDDIDYSSVIKFANELQSFKDNLPYRMNVIRSAARGQLKEIAHSMILADLLHEKCVLKSFLDKFLPSTCSEKSDYKIRREFSYIDLCLENDSNIIIIENKINDAIEQDNQIYRYVSEVKDKNKTIFVLYLKSIDNAMPSDTSIKGKDGDDVFSFMDKKNFKVLSYKLNVLPWLKKLRDDVENEYIKTSLFQYIDYLKMKFNMPDENKKEIMEYINKLLNIGENDSADTKCSCYNKLLKKQNELCTDIENLRFEVAKEQS